MIDILVKLALGVESWGRVIQKRNGSAPDGAGSKINFQKNYQ